MEERTSIAIRDCRLLFGGAPSSRTRNRFLAKDQNSCDNPFGGRWICSPRTQKQERTRGIHQKDNMGPLSDGRGHSRERYQPPRTVSRWRIFTHIAPQVRRRMATSNHVGNAGSYVQSGIDSRSSAESLGTGKELRVSNSRAASKCNCKLSRGQSCSAEFQSHVWSFLYCIQLTVDLLCSNVIHHFEKTRSIVIVTNRVRMNLMAKSMCSRGHRPWINDITTAHCQFICSMIRQTGIFLNWFLVGWQDSFAYDFRCS